jgi:hypothetical protein
MDAHVVRLAFDPQDLVHRHDEPVATIRDHEAAQIGLRLWWRRGRQPVVYLSGILMFVAGLAIVRAHNVWRRDWTVLVSLSGWFFLLLGLFRMFAAGLYQRGSARASSMFFMILEGLLFVVGLIMTARAYSRSAT